MPFSADDTRHPDLPYPDDPRPTPGELQDMADALQWVEQQILDLSTDARRAAGGIRELQSQRCPVPEDVHNVLEAANVAMQKTRDCISVTFQCVARARALFHGGTQRGAA